MFTGLIFGFLAGAGTIMVLYHLHIIPDVEVKAMKLASEFIDQAESLISNVKGLEKSEAAKLMSDFANLRAKVANWIK